MPEYLNDHPNAALIRERVARGVAWLDTERPDWRKRVDTARLDLSSCSTCVLGHVFDASDECDTDPWRTSGTGFDIGVRILNTNLLGTRLTPYDGSTEAPAVTHGFDTWGDDESPYSYDALEAGWLEVLDA